MCLDIDELKNFNGGFGGLIAYTYIGIGMVCEEGSRRGSSAGVGLRVLFCSIALLRSYSWHDAYHLVGRKSAVICP